MEQEKIKLPILNFPAQQSIFNCPSRFVIVAKGRRFGLTRGAANDFIKSALMGTFKKGLWVDTVNANIERYVERYFIPALKKLPEDIWYWRKQQKILEIKDAYIDFRSADTPENIEGFGYDKAFLNEAGIILKSQYLWDNAIKPMLWDYKCHTIIGGAPKGKGIFFQLFNRGNDPEQTDYTSFRFTSFDNPYIQHDVIMEDIKTSPERVVQQEIYAQFLDDTGVVFRGVSQVAILEPEEPKQGELYVIGCDLAKVQDWTVLAVYSRKTNNQVYQMRFKQLEWPFQKERIKELSKKYNNALVYIDSTGLGEPIYEDLVRAQVPCESIKFTNESKKQMIEKLSNWIELKNCRMLNIEDTINELNVFTYDYSEKTHRVMYNAPVGFHDDIVFSHALAIWGLQPIIESKVKPVMGVIEKDLYEKKKTLQDEQRGVFDPNEYEVV
jgi:phage FluMu gp28-like protein